MNNYEYEYDKFPFDGCFFFLARLAIVFMVVTVFVGGSYYWSKQVSQLLYEIDRLQNKVEQLEAKEHGQQSMPVVANPTPETDR